MKVRSSRHRMVAGHGCSCRIFTLEERELGAQFALYAKG